MTPRPSIQPIVTVPFSLLLATGCAQGTMGISPSTIINTVILAGEVIGSRTERGSGSGTTTSGRAPNTRRAPASPAPTAVAARVLEDADQFVGVPYTWGGNTPESGFDCSGFTRFVYAKQGIALPRTSREQARAGQRVATNLASLLAGDIMLFAEPGEAISHVAIYVGNGEIIHSSSSGRGVRYDDLNTHRGDWYVQNMVAARRLTSNGRSLVQRLRYLNMPGTPLDPPDRAPAPR